MKARALANTGFGTGVNSSTAKKILDSLERMATPLKVGALPCLPLLVILDVFVFLSGCQENSQLRGVAGCLSSLVHGECSSLRAFRGCCSTVLRAVLLCLSLAALFPQEEKQQLQTTGQSPPLPPPSCFRNRLRGTMDRGL